MRISILSVTALLLATLASSAVAGDYCVGSVDELRTALTAAANSGTAVIKVRQGSYDVGGTALVSTSQFGSLQLRGGYSDDTCASRVLNPANTVFDAHGAEALITMHGSLVIEGVQWQNYTGERGLYFNFIVDGHDFNAFVSESVFTNSVLTLRLYDDIGVNAEFDVINNLFEAPASVPDLTDGLLSLRDEGADTSGDVGGANVTMRVTSNTIVASPGTGLYLLTTGDSVLTNNICWGSTGFDVRIEGDHGPGSAVFFDNTYPSGSLFGAEAAGSFGTSHADPAFVGGGNYHLQSGSPAINSGTVNVPIAGTDLDGKYRVSGSTIDRGAYESVIDDTIPQTIVVTSADPQGAGTLNQAIADANANPDFTYIEFNIPGTCPITISPLQFGSTYFALPTLTAAAKIDGFTQPGSAPNTALVGDNATRCIIIDGAGMVGTGIGFSGDSTTHLWVQGLAFEGFTGAALSLGGGNGDIVLGNQFGGKVGGVSLTSNGTGIKLAQSARNALIGYDSPAFRNVIGGATDYGISIGAIGSGGTGHTIAGNLFGIYGDGFFAGADGNTRAIHVTTGGNTITSNLFGSNSIAVELTGANAAANAIEGNGIGRIPPTCIVINHVPECSSDAVPNQSGIYISGGAHDNLVESNTIWNGSFGGIQINDASPRNMLWANSVDANGDSAVALGGTIEGDNDADSGAADLPNRGLNSPVVERAYGGTRAGVLDGTLDSTNDSYSIQIYASAPPAGGYSRYGEYYLGAGTASITHQPMGANGHASFHLSFASPGMTLAGMQITLMATDSLGNTSEFSTAVLYVCDVIFRNEFQGDASDGCPAP